MKLPAIMYFFRSKLIISEIVVDGQLQYGSQAGKSHLSTFQKMKASAKKSVSEADLIQQFVSKLGRNKAPVTTELAQMILALMKLTKVPLNI